MNAEDLEYSVLGYFWHIKNGRAISMHEKKGLDEKIGFIAFGYLDALTRRGLCDLGTHETLKSAAETCGEFLTMPDGTEFRRFCNSFALLRLRSRIGRRACGWR